MSWWLKGEHAAQDCAPCLVQCLWLLKSEILLTLILINFLLGTWSLVKVIFLNFSYLTPKSAGESL